MLWGVLDVANKEDPNELSFSKGEVLYVHEKKGSWWQAKKSTGAVGMIPSNYVSLHKSLNLIKITWYQTSFLLGD